MTITLRDKVTTMEKVTRTRTHTVELDTEDLTVLIAMAVRDILECPPDSDVRISWKADHAHCSEGIPLGCMVHVTAETDVPT